MLLCLLIYLILCVYFSVVGRFVTSPALGDVTLYRRCFMEPSSTVPSDHQSQMLQGFSLCGLYEPFCCVGPTAAGVLVGRTDLQHSWLCGCWCLTAVGMLVGRVGPSTPECEAWWHVTAIGVLVDGRMTSLKR